MFVSEISREEINLLTIRHFGGKIHLIDTKEKFDAAFPHIMQHQILVGVVFGWGISPVTPGTGIFSALDHFD